MRRLFGYQWVQWIRPLYQRRWLPLVLGCLVTIAIFGLWQQLLMQEQRHVQQVVQQEADAIASELNRALSVRILALDRMAHRWQATHGTPQALWEADATQHFEDFYGYQAIEWVDPSFRVRWVVPLQGNEVVKNLDLSQEPRLQITLRVAHDLRQPLLTHTTLLPQGGDGFFACVPLFVERAGGIPEGDRFDGFIVGVFQYQSLFDSLLQVSPRYKVQIHDSKGLIYSQTNVLSSAPPTRGIVQAYGADWQVQVFPTPALMAAERSPLPSFVLWGGLAIAWTLALTVYLSQRAGRYVRRARQSNQQLQDEILHRHQVEASLRASEERWQLALRGNNDGIWDWNLQTNQVFFSDRWKGMLGFANDEISHHLNEWITRIHPDDLLWVTEAVQDHFDQKTSFYRSEHRLLCKDGSYKWILDRGQALWDEAGHAIRMVGSHTDISERKQAEVALRESEVKYRNLINHLNAGFVVHAPDTQILQCNEAACDLLGLSMDQMLGKTAIDPDWHFVREDGTVMPVEEYPVNRVLSTQRLLKNYVLGIRKGADLQVWVLVTAFPEFDPQQQLKQVVVIFIDISEQLVALRERKRAEIDLVESQRQYQTLAENSPDIIERFDLNLRHLYVSAALTQITGIAADVFLGKTCRDLGMDEAMVNTWETAATALLRTQQKQIIEFSSLTLQGMRDFEMAIVPELSDHQTVESILCISRDITERKQVETALRQSEATKRAIIQAIPDLLMRMQADGSNVELISNSSFNIVNFDQMPQGASVYDVLPADLAQLRLAHVQHALVSGTPQMYEQEILISGKQCYEEVRIVPLLSTEVLVMVRDITDRKQAEKDLWHQKEMFQVIVDCIPVMIALFNQTGQIEFVNPEFEKVLGWSLAKWQQQTVLAQGYADVTYPQPVIEQILAASGRWKDSVTLAATGQQIETSWANVRLSNGQFLGIGQDISDRKHKELALQQAMEVAEAANVAKSLFLANMSHELRTPLNVILGFAQVMAHDPSLTPHQQEDLQAIRRSGDYLLSLINDVLDLSKIESGHCEINPTAFDLVALLHSLQHMLTERATSKGITLDFDLASTVPSVIIADEQKLRQVLLNLLSNAIKFTCQGSVMLRVTGLVPTDLDSASILRLQFEVIDTGTGIASEDLDLIFDAFVQAQAGKQSTSGTGLGLTISRKLLELMGGEISVHSVLGQGSTFAFTLPVYPSSRTELKREQRDRLVIGLASGQPHWRILVVDDQRENRLLLVRLLTLLGLEVREASNGSEAIQIWQDWQPDLIWMDIRMPGIDGYEATKQIRAMEQGQPSVIIALTAQASQSDRTLALAAGCNDYISKPFPQEVFYFKMKEYLDLQYLYAKSNPQPIDQPVATVLDEEWLHSLDPALIAMLSAEWLAALEDAAVCGYDRAIADLAAALPPQLAPLAQRFTDLAGNYQFEQILHLLRQL